ncbi:uncharacterized protein LOC131222654 isoform X2 [Magnolia sinica]|uniref:uncharacterized protein LOC131222654 isoform X2 n=1 Tax=Magnolia sinica TaxID=86752 RepID=UPI00265A5B72|nr:uncharacterized protein LOC131222654 isoform X2 [Magnolia sinica]
MATSTTSPSFTFSKSDLPFSNPRKEGRIPISTHFDKTHLLKIVSSGFPPLHRSHLNGYRSQIPSSTHLNKTYLLKIVSSGFPPPHRSQLDGYRYQIPSSTHFNRNHLKIVSSGFRPLRRSNSNGHLSVSCSAASLVDPSEGKSFSAPISTTDSPEVEVRTTTWDWRGYHIRYQFAGNSGPALVLVHGFGANSDHWRKNIPFLAKSHRVYSIDLIGYGYSDKPNPRVVGLQAAIMEPQICKGILLLNISLRMLHIKKQPWYGRPFIRSFQSLLRNTVVGQLFYKAVATPKSVRSILCQCYYDTSKVTDELVQKILLPGLEPGAVDVFLDFICYSGGPLPDELLTQVKCPVLVAWGDKDPWEPIKLGKAYGDFDAVEDFIVLPNVGHCPQDEAPDLVNPLVESFVARHAMAKANANPRTI